MIGRNVPELHRNPVIWAQFLQSTASDVSDSTRTPSSSASEEVKEEDVSSTDISDSRLCRASGQWVE